MSNDVLDLLLSHEIGHALYTPMKEWQNAVDEEKIPHSFLNVIEDARIEKLMKRRYPGLAKDFYTGYKELSEKLLLPIKTDCHDLDLTSSNLLLKKQVEKLPLLMMNKINLQNALKT